MASSQNFKTRLETTLDLTITLNWKHIFKNTFYIYKDSKLQWLQYRINNIILDTQHLLQKGYS